MKNKIISSIVVIGVTVSLCSCGAGQTTVSETEAYSYGTMGACTGQGGIYVGMDSLLHYHDRELGEDVVFCNKPNCEHEPYDSTSNTDPSCDAALNKDLNMKCILFTDGVYVYLIGDADLQRGVIYRQKMDGSAREKWLTMDCQCYENMQGYVRDGKAYLIANEPVITKDNVGGAGSKTGSYVLICIDLQKGTYEKISQVRDYEFQGMRLFGTYEDTLYYEFGYRENQEKFEDYEKAEDKVENYAYNMKSGKTEQGISEEEIKEKTTYEAEGVDSEAVFFNQFVFCRVEDKTALALYDDYKAGNGKVLVAKGFGKTGEVDGQ